MIVRLPGFLYSRWAKIFPSYPLDTRECCNGNHPCCGAARSWVQLVGVVFFFCMWTGVLWEDVRRSAPGECRNFMLPASCGCFILLATS